MKRILITGGSGFIGRNILPILGNAYSIAAPPHVQFNTADAASVDACLASNKFDILLHLASPKDRNLSDILKGFANLQKHADKFDRIFYTGSGAEYNKAYDIKMAREEQISQTVPQDDYGLGKYINNMLARSSKNIYNLRIFGCYGPTDPPGKFITDAINSCLKGGPATIRQDCLFDYMFVEDFARIAMHFIEHKPKYHDYNACTGRPAMLSEIAKIAARQTGVNKPAVIAKAGLNNEYTASNARILAELGENFKFTSLEEGIAKQIAWQKTL